MHITAISLLSFLFSFVFRVNEIAKLRGPNYSLQYILVYTSICTSKREKEREREREREKKKFGELKEEKEIFHSYYTYPRDLAWQSRCTTAAVLLILCSFRTSQTSLPLLLPLSLYSSLQLLLLSFSPYAEKVYIFEFLLALSPQYFNAP